MSASSLCRNQAANAAAMSFWQNAPWAHVSQRAANCCGLHLKQMTAVGRWRHSPKGSISFTEPWQHFLLSRTWMQTHGFSKSNSPWTPLESGEEESRLRRLIIVTDCDICSPATHLASSWSFLFLWPPFFSLRKVFPSPPLCFQKLWLIHVLFEFSKCWKLTYFA